MFSFRLPQFLPLAVIHWAWGGKNHRSDLFLFRDSGLEGSCRQVGFQNESPPYSPVRTQSSLPSSSPSLSPHSALIPWNLAYLTARVVTGKAVALHRQHAVRLTYKTRNGLSPQSLASAQCKPGMDVQWICCLPHPQSRGF